MQLPASIPKPARQVLLALGAATAALAVQWALVPWVGPRLPFMVIEPAIIFTAATLGRWPALLVMLIGAFNAVLALPPTGQLRVNDSADQVALLAYAVIGALLIAYGGRLHLRNRRAERAEQRLSLAQDETGVGLFELDYRANTAYASPALCQILGQPVMQGAMPLQQWLHALNAGHVADSSRVMEAKVAAGELRYERELHVELPDGQHHWLLSRIRLDLDAGGALAAARGATLDITSRKQLLTELEAAQAKLQQQLDDLNRLHDLGNRVLAMPVLDAALQSILDAVCAFHDTPFGILQLCERGGSRVGAHCGLEHGTLVQFAPPNHAVQYHAVCGPAARSGQRVVVEDIQCEASLAALVPAAHALGVRALHSTPLIAGGSGRVLGVLTVMLKTHGQPDERLCRLTDLCAAQAAALVEREHALSLARETQQRFEVALQSSAVAFTVLAPVRDNEEQIIDFSWSYANPAAAALIGRPARELIGQRIIHVLPSAWDEPGSLERYVDVSVRGCTAEFDTLVRRPGGPRWLHVLASPLNDSVVLWFADITQRREEQQALQDADRRKDEFLATLAHELRNPLAPIRHAADIIDDPAANETQRQWSLGVIGRQLQHMTVLLDDLLDVSRITRGTLRLRRERCELRPIVDAAVETVQPLFAQRKHRLVIDLPDDAIWLDVDPLRFGQVIGNLLMNACKYTPPGGEVVLRARQDAEALLLSVADNGDGLRAEDCERVFEMFTQLHAPHARAQGGLGIGLALARRLMAMHGGSLVAASPGSGLGSTFTAQLPVPEAVSPPIPRPIGEEPAAAMPEPARPLRVLVADDNRDAADSVTMLLRLEGHEVAVAYDGVAALACYGRFRPDVALLDMGMPGHTGADLAAMIRRRPDGAGVTLIAVTGFGQRRDREQALNAGFDHHMTKPIPWDELQSLLNTVT